MTALAKITALISATRHALVVLAGIAGQLIALDVVHGTALADLQVALAIATVIGVHVLPTAAPVAIAPTDDQPPAPDVASAPVSDTLPAAVVTPVPSLPST